MARLCASFLLQRLTCIQGVSLGRVLIGAKNGKFGSAHILRLNNIFRDQSFIVDNGFFPTLTQSSC
jgi:hypothetical protein